MEAVGGKVASSAWLLEATDEPERQWSVVGQGAVVFEGTSTKPELVAACLLHCACAVFIGAPNPCSESHGISAMALVCNDMRSDTDSWHRHVKM